MGFSRADTEAARVFASLDDDGRAVLGVVIKVESKHLHVGTPRGLVEELKAAIESVVQ